MLEFRKALFDAIVLFVVCIAVFALLFAVTFIRDDGGSPHSLNMLKDGVVIVVLVAQHYLSLTPAQQGDGLDAVMHPSSGHYEVQWLAKFIGKQVDIDR